MNRINTSKKNTEWLPSVLGGKKAHTTSKEKWVLKVVYKSDKKHLETGLQVENTSYPHQLPNESTRLI